MASNALRQSTKSFHESQGQMNYLLEIFGDDLARREGYANLDGIEAVYFYLIHKFSWLPRDVRSMTFDDIRFVLSQELEGWTVPVDAP